MAKSKTKKKRLGRGLDALLGGDEAASLANAMDIDTAQVVDEMVRQEQISGKGQFREMPVAFLQRGQYQPRSVMDESALNELAASIASQGVMQPILVRPLKQKNRFEIIAGERRWRAAQKAGLSEVPVIVRAIPDEAAMAMALIENIQREDLNALEEARGIQRLLDEFGFTHQQAAEAIGRSRTAVSNLLRLLTLSPAVQKMLEARQLDMGHARSLLALPEKDQAAAAQKILLGGLSVRGAEALVKEMLESADQGNTAAKKPTTKDDPDIRRLQDKLSAALGASVAIKDNSGKGKVIIGYHSLDELDGIIGKIQG